MVYNILHSTGEQICGTWFNDFCLFWCIVKEYIAIFIQDLCVKHRLDISSVVGNCRIGGSQFQVAHTSCDTTQSGGLSDIRVHIAVYGECIHNSGETEFQQIIICKLWCYIGNTDVYKRQL